MEYLRDVVEYGFGNSSGPNMAGRFERAFAERLGFRYAVAVCNGTATMHAGLAAGGVKPGDEVIVPPLTAGATAFCVLHQGAVPVFADIDPRTFNIDPEAVRRRITPLTRAVIPVGLYGLSADMDPIMAIAREHNLLVIEDNAECFLGLYKNRVAGKTGHAASYSFQASKHLTCGDGGIVCTDDEALAVGMRKFCAFGYHTLSAGRGGTIPKQQRGHPASIRHDSLGWNYRMSELQAAVALEQTERIDELVGLRMKIGAMFAQAVGDCPFLVPQHTPSDCMHSYWTFVCRFEPEIAACSWDTFRNLFYALGGDFLYGAWRLTYNEPVFQERRFLGGGFPIDSPVYRGNHRDYGSNLCPVAESLQPKLMQFKTNYYHLDQARRQADVLRQTVECVQTRCLGRK
jgi:perosamine synthetase